MFLRKIFSTRKYLPLPPTPQPLPLVTQQQLVWDGADTLRHLSQNSARDLAGPKTKDPKHEDPTTT